MTNLSETPIYFQEPMASILDNQREQIREKRRITYDCHNAIYPQTGDKVLCRLHHRINSKGSSRNYMPLLSVLKGSTVIGCRSCFDFNGEEEEEEEL